MKFPLFILLLIMNISAFSVETVEQRLVKLEQTVKAQSDSIATYKAKVAEVEKQKSFLGDIYSTNIGWASLVLSILVAGVFGLTVYTVVDNSGKVKEVKDEFKSDIETLYSIHKSLSSEVVNNKISSTETSSNLKNDLNKSLSINEISISNLYSIISELYSNNLNYEDALYYRLISYEKELPYYMNKIEDIDERDYFFHNFGTMIVNFNELLDKIEAKNGLTLLLPEIIGKIENIKKLYFNITRGKSFELETLKERTLNIKSKQSLSF